jgi:NUBPL iron-transfer P-loop NTPase
LIAVNLAVALANAWKLNVGLLDADIYGPSIPTMMNLHQKPDVSEGTLYLSCYILACNGYNLYCTATKIKIGENHHHHHRFNLLSWQMKSDYFLFIFVSRHEDDSN